MSHRTALALSIVLTLLLAVGIVVERDRLFAPPAIADVAGPTPVPTWVGTGVADAGTPATELPGSLAEVDRSTRRAPNGSDRDETRPVGVQRSRADRDNVSGHRTQSDQEDEENEGEYEQDED